MLSSQASKEFKPGRGVALDPSSTVQQNALNFHPCSGLLAKTIEPRLGRFQGHVVKCCFMTQQQHQQRCKVDVDGSQTIQWSIRSNCVGRPGLPGPKGPHPIATAPKGAGRSVRGSGGGPRADRGSS